MWIDTTVLIEKTEEKSCFILPCINMRNYVVSPWQQVAENLK
jgi:hypothetical protein